MADAINPKIIKAMSLDRLNQMSPMEALQSGLSQAPDIQTQAKMNALQQLKGANRPEQEDMMLKLQGRQTMDASKAQDANNVINRTKQDISDLEDQAQFGEDVGNELASKKELLRRYMMNNQ